MKAMALMIFMSGLALGGTTETFRQANADYAEGKYAEAAKSYEQILKADGPRVAVLRNLGSAYFKMDEIGRAILAFERALMLKPHDPDLLANLKIAQDEAAVYPASSGSAWHAFLGRLSARDWSKIALVAAILLLPAALAWVFRKGKARLGIALFAIADLAAFGIALAGIDARSEESDRGIVIGKPATVRISPFETADARGSLSQGREVHLGEKSGGYLWISADGGSQEGWVAEDEVAPLIPDRESQRR